MKILVADDHQIVRYGLKLMVKSIWPRARVEAENLDAAVNLISSNNISLMIFDVNMPDEEKLEELIRFIVKEAKAVIFSGYEKTSPCIELLLAAGANAFIFKDSSVVEIKEILASLFMNSGPEMS
ncbi:response regulator transcription factor [Pedobacter frigidisoli]|uniref:Response regulator transcription factor n=1 Tax=Pedobacter frigidisoli TaxID=2530455 RepID=A0A4R0P2Z4_9SPHI|nr:response regulator [Pedobacter frigidisoli]TCD11205.1 response regulator transcription factor [Pedobacter frigidisoli]